MIGYYLQAVSISSENKLNAFNLGLLCSICSLFNIIYIVLFPLILIWMSFLQKMSIKATNYIISWSFNSIFNFKI